MFKFYLYSFIAFHMVKYRSNSYRRLSYSSLSVNYTFVRYRFKQTFPCYIIIFTPDMNKKADGGPPLPQPPPAP